MRISLIILFLFISLSAQARLHGQARLDSLLKELDSKKSEKKDTNYVDLLYTISLEISQSNPDMSIKYGLESLKLAEGLHNKYHIAWAHNSLASGYRFKGDFATSLQHFFLTLTIAEGEKGKRFEEQVRVANFNIGAVYLSAKENAKALVYLRKVAIMAGQTGDKTMAAASSNAIGAIFQQQDLLDSALKYQLKARALFEEIGNEPNALRAEFNTANIYGSQKKYELAMETYEDVLKKNEKLKIPDIWTTAYGSIGDFLYEQTTIIAGVHRITDPVKVRNYLTKATNYLSKALEYCHQMNDIEAAINFERYLAMANADLGNYKHAYEAHQRYSDLLDTLYSSDKRLTLANLETQREAELKQKQININQILQSDKKKERLFYAIAALLLSVIIVLIFRNYSRQRSVNQVLATTNNQLNDEQARLVSEKIKSDKLAASLQESLVLKEALANQLSVAAEMKTRFLANISHELRTPVTLLTGMLELIQVQTRDKPDGNNEKLKVAYNNSRKLQRMVEEILDLSRLESINSTINHETIEACTIIKRQVYAFETFIAQNKLKLDYCDDAAAGAFFTVDTDKFEKVINNLVYNAVKYNTKGGWIKINVHLSSDKQTLLIDITNSGKGISDADLPHIFERFYQGDTNGAKAEGAGIGLSLVKEFTTLMNGTVTVKSSPGQSTTFFLQFPATQPVQVSQIPMVHKEAEVAVPVINWEHFDTRQTVLLVDDNYEMRYYLRNILGDKVNIAEAGNGKEAMEWLAVNTPDLIITDLMMPEMDGRALVAAIKRDTQSKTIPVITLTALTGKENQLEMLRMGIDDYIVKPFNADELRVRVYNLLNNSAKRKTYVLEPAEPEDIPLESKEAEEFKTKVTEFVLTRIKNPNVSVYDIAYGLAMSERQLYRLAKSLTGCSPAQLIKEVRLQKAYELLSGGTITKLEEVSKQVGFETANYFSKQFYERFGKRPTEFL